MTARIAKSSARPANTAASVLSLLRVLKDFQSCLYLCYARRKIGRESEVQIFEILHLTLGNPLCETTVKNL